MRSIKLFLLMVVSFGFLSADCSAMESKIFQKPSGSMFRRMRAMLPPDLLGGGCFFSTTPVKFAQPAALKKDEWTWDPVKQLHYAGKPVKSLSVAQRHRKPVIDDPKADMVVYNTIKEMSEVVEVPAFKFGNVKKK